MTFNPERFINVHAHKPAQYLGMIRDIAANDDLRASILAKPMFTERQAEEVQALVTSIQQRIFEIMKACK